MTGKKIKTDLNLLQELSLHIHKMENQPFDVHVCSRECIILFTIQSTVAVFVIVADAASQAFEFRLLVLEIEI